MTKDEKYMRWCVAGAKLFATCGKRQYMSIILGADGRVLATGYNGGPSGMKHCVDGGCPRFLEGSASGSSYDNCIAIHSEENSLLYSDRTARVGGTIYVNGPPCFGCAKKIANSGLRRLVYMPDPAYADFPRIADFLRRAGVELTCLEDLAA